MDLLYLVAAELDITTPTVFASEYDVKTTSTRRLVDLVGAVGGTHYLTGLGAVEYLDESLFHKNSIQVVWQKFQHPVYGQLYGDFIPVLSSLDFLMMKAPS
jgi:hypothetical protein